MTFGERLMDLRKSRGFTRESFAKYLGISKYTLRNYELSVNEPNSSFLKQISDMFNVSIDYLMAATDEKERIMPYQLKSSEYEHIEKYRDLDDHGKDMVDTVLDKEWQRSTADQKPETPAPVSIIREPEPDYLIPNAAHDIPGASEEAKALADALMDNDEFWK